jgi:hypothetical protein
MNARATLSNGRTVKKNGGGTVVVRATQDNLHILGPFAIILTLSL